MKRAIRAPRRRLSEAKCALVGAVALVCIGAASSPRQTDPIDALAQVRVAVDDGYYARAETAARDLVRSLEGSPVARADAVLLLAEALRFSDRVLGDEALATADQAVALAQALPGDERERIAASLLNLGHLRYMRDEYAEARTSLEASLAVDASRSQPQARAGLTLTLLADLTYDQTHQRDAADAIFARAKAVQDATLDPNHRDVGFRYLLQGNVASGASDYEGARQEYDRAIDIWRAVLRPGHPLTARALSNLGNALQGSGRYVEARKCLREALEMRIEAYGPKHRHVASTLNNLARLEFLLNNPADAREYWRQALEIESASGGAHSQKAYQYLLGIGDCLTQEQELSDAAQAYERALSIVVDRQGGDTPSATTVLLMLACTRASLGEHDESARLLERAERVLAADESDVYGRASLAMIQSWVDLQQNHVPGARAPLIAALDLVSARLGENLPVGARLLDALADVDAAAGDTDSALKHELRAAEIQRENQIETGRMLDERGSLALGGMRTRYLNQALELVLATEHAELRERTWDALARSRGLVFETIAARARIARQSSYPSVAETARKLAEARDELARLTVHGADGQSPDEFKACLENARARKQAAEEELAALDHQQPASSRDPEFRLDSLPAGSALVSYVCCSPKTGDPFYLAFSMGPARGSPLVRRIGSAHEIDALVSRTLAAARNPLDLENYRAVAGELKKRIWDALESELEGAREILVVPDGALSVVNFAALPAGESAFLAETAPLIRIFGTERDLARITSPATGHGLLALGGAAFDADAPLLARAEAIPPREGSHPRAATAELPASYAALSFSPLPGSAAEIETVKSLWLASTRAKTATPHPDDEVVLLAGDRATEANFKRNAPGRRVLHLATHGFCVTSERAPSAVSARGVSTVLAAPATVPALSLEPSEDPLLLSGLALAGANHRRDAQPGADDGILTAEEIASLDLSSVECAVLSACDTGLGEIASGEGIYGLRRAFQMAGARSLVVSLWPVDDATTSAWMTALYSAGLADGVDTAAAVREASLATLASRRKRGQSVHPYYWCAFVAIDSARALCTPTMARDSTRDSTTGRR